MATLQERYQTFLATKNAQEALLRQRAAEGRSLPNDARTLERFAAQRAAWEARLAASGGGNASTTLAMAVPAAATGALGGLKSAMSGIPTAAIYGAGAVAAVGAGVGVAALVGSRRKKRKSSRRSKRGAGKSKSRRGSRGSRPRKTRNRRGGAVKDRYKGRKVYRTKRGQPYVLLRNGQARFVRA